MPTKRFNVATFNTLNLVLPGIMFYGNKKYSKADYGLKKAWIRHQIDMGDINDGVTAVISEIMSGTPPYKYLLPEEKAATRDVLPYNVKDLQSQVSLQDTYYTHIFNRLLRKSGSHLCQQRVCARQSPVSRVCGVCQGLQRPFDRRNAEQRGRADDVVRSWPGGGDD